MPHEPSSLDERMRNRFQGNFLDALDIKKMPNSRAELEIASVVPPNEERDSQKKLIDKPIIGFTKAKKRLILTPLNEKIVNQQLGEKPSEWIGKRITLTVRYLKKAFGEFNVPVIRVVPRSEAELTFGMRRNYGAAQPFDAE